MPVKQTNPSSLRDGIVKAFRSKPKGDKTQEFLYCKNIPGFHLVKLKSGESWRFRYQDANGRRRVATIGTYSSTNLLQAAAQAYEWQQGLKQGRDVLADKQRQRKEAIKQAEQATARTLGQYLEGTYKDYQNKKRSGAQTLAMIKFNFSHLLDRDMASITKADILQWQAKREADGAAHLTIKRAYSALVTMVHHAHKNKLLETYPLADIELEGESWKETNKRLSPEKQSERRALTNDEIERLHNGLDGFAAELRKQRRSSRAHGKPHLPDLEQVTYPHWFIPFCHVALHTGLRTGDIYSLTWLELNINFGMINKIPEKTRDKINPAQINMPLNDDLLTVMRAWHEQQGKPTSGLVFPSPVTGNRLDKNAHDRPWDKVRKLGKLPDSLVFYALRHNYISRLVQANFPLLEIAKLVGHKSVMMIERNYYHLNQERSREAVDFIGKSVGKRKPKRAKA